MRKTLILATLLLATPLFAAAPAGALEDSAIPIQIYSPWNEYYARIYRGLEHGVSKGMKFTVWRGEQKLGVFEVSDVGESISRGKFIPDSPDFYLVESVAVDEVIASKEVAEADIYADMTGKTPAPAPAASESPEDRTKDFEEKLADKKLEYYEFEVSSSVNKESGKTADSPAPNADEKAPEEKLYADQQAPRQKVADAPATPQDKAPSAESLSFQQHAEAGKNLFSLNLFTEAMAHFSAALKVSPENNLVQNYFVASAAKMGILGDELKNKPVPDIRETSPSVDSAELARVWNNYGVHLMSAGLREEALQQFTLALMFNPGEASYFRNRAIAFFKLGNVNNALEDAKKAVDMGDEPAARLLAQMNKLKP